MAQFSTSSLFAEFDFSHQYAVRCEKSVLPPFLFLKSFDDYNDIAKSIRTVTKIEHECFHCRHFLTSSTGYALYLTRQMMNINKLGIINNGFYQLMLDHLSSGGTNNIFECAFQLLKTYRKKPTQASDGEFFRAVTNLFRNSLSLDLIESLTEEKIKVFYELYKNEKPSTIIIPLLKNINKPKSDHIFHQSQLLTTSELLEGLAFWREFAYLAYISQNFFKDKYGTLTNDFFEINSNTMYRKATDLIFRETNCDMSMALPGILMDIALCGPFFSMKKRAWEEVLPSLRLYRILSIIDKFPDSYKKINSLDSLASELYFDIDKLICKNLGWTRIENNIKKVNNAIIKRIEYGRKEAKKRGSEDLIGSFYDRRFHLGMQTRISKIKSILFDYALPVDFIQPPIQIYSDRIVGNPLSIEHVSVEDDGHILLYLYDLVVSLFLDGLINDNLFPEYSQTFFQKARRIYRLRDSALKDNEFKGIGANENFEYFISNQLGIDYPVVMRQLGSFFSAKKHDAKQRKDNLKPIAAKSIKIGRNDLCPCGSGIKYKKCCLK